MKVKDIIFGLNKLAPYKYAYDWDNVGLLVGDLETNVNNIYVALDATDSVIDHAIAKKANLLITHHPLMFSPIKSVLNDDMVGRRIVRMIKNDLSYIAIHTNFDACVMGNLVADKISISKNGRQVLDEIEDTGFGIGAIGEIKETTLEEYAKLIKERLRLPFVEMFGDGGTKIRRVAVVPGAGKSEIEIAIQKNADVLVTGDIGHHSGIDAVARGLNILDAGHFGLEHVFIQYMQLWLHEQYEDINVMGEDIKFPISMV